MASEGISQYEQAPDGKVTLDYAPPETNRSDWNARLIILCLLAFLAIGGFFLGLVLYMTHVS